MRRAFARYTAPLALLIALTVVPAFASGETERVTGGGWIEGAEHYIDATPDENALPPGAEESSVFAAAGNTKCTFGFVASRTPIETGGWEYDGELTFHDHNKGFKVKSVCVTFVDINPALNQAIFAGQAEVRSSAGTVCTPFKVTVVDGGEPSTADKFRIELPEWVAPGDPAGFEYGVENCLGGGNIQLHQ